MKENRTQYIPESKEYIINGKVVREKELTEAEKRKLKGAKKVKIITAECASPAGVLLV